MFEAMGVVESCTKPLVAAYPRPATSINAELVQVLFMLAPEGLLQPSSPAPPAHLVGSLDALDLDVLSQGTC